MENEVQRGQGSACVQFSWSYPGLRTVIIFESVPVSIPVLKIFSISVLVSVPVLKIFSIWFSVISVPVSVLVLATK